MLYSFLTGRFRKFEDLKSDGDFRSLGLFPRFDEENFQRNFSIVEGESRSLSVCVGTVADPCSRPYIIRTTCEAQELYPRSTFVSPGLSTFMVISSSLSQEQVNSLPTLSPFPHTDTSPSHNRRNLSLVSKRISHRERLISLKLNWPKSVKSSRKTLLLVLRFRTRCWQSCVARTLT